MSLDKSARFENPEPRKYSSTERKRKRGKKQRRDQSEGSKLKYNIQTTLKIPPRKKQQGIKQKRGIYPSTMPSVSFESNPLI